MECLRMFTKAQTAADRWLSEFHGRSQAALWEVLAMAYDVYRDAVEQPEKLEEAAAALGVKVRKDAPNRMSTVVLKIVFRPEFHHGLATAFAGWAKVLAWLNKHNVEPGLAARVIGDNAGVHGVAKLFSKENRKAQAGELKSDLTGKIAKAVKVFPEIGTLNNIAGGTVLTINTGKDVKTLEGLAQQPGYILLVARVDDNFELSDLRIIDRDLEKISRIVANRSRNMSGNMATANDNGPNIMKEAV